MGAKSRPWASSFLKYVGGCNAQGHNLASISRDLVCQSETFFEVKPPLDRAGCIYEQNSVAVCCSYIIPIGELKKIISI